MHPSPLKRNRRRGASGAVLSLAKHLQRAALSDALSLSLPVLRRVLAAGVLRGLSLPQLRRQRSMIQRKHVLRMLAVEAGFPNWEAYSRELQSMDVASVPHFDVHRAGASHLNLWFSSQDEALAYAQDFGGQVIPVGRQAVVLAPRAELLTDAPVEAQP